MSVIERVRQIQAENEQRKSRDTVAVQEAQQKTTTVKEARINFLITQRDRLTQECGVVSILQQLENGFLENTDQNHRIFQRAIKPDSDEYYIWLAWGYEKSQEHDGGIWGENYKSLSIIINCDTEIITINGKDVQRKQWLKNNGLVEELIAQAFLTPHVHIEERVGYESGWS